MHFRNYFFRFFGILLIAFSCAETQARQEVAPRILLPAWESPGTGVSQSGGEPADLRLAVELRDGSRIIGFPLRPLLFKAGSAIVRIDPAELLRLEATDESGTATVLLVNGETLAGRLMAPIRLRTVLGLLAIPVRLVSEIYPYGALYNGLIAYWPFEGNGQDSVGDHLLGGAAMNYAPGILGQAMSQQGNVESFNVGYTGDIDLNRDFTISFWAYRESSIYDNDAVFDNGSVYIAKRDADGWASRMGAIITSLDDGRRVDLVDNSGLGEPPLQMWFHVVVYRTGDQIAMKVNAAGTASVNVSGMNLGNRGTMFLGKQTWGYPWQGRLDEFGIWNRALTPQEIQALYNHGKALRPGQTPSNGISAESALQ